MTKFVSLQLKHSLFFRKWQQSLVRDCSLRHTLNDTTMNIHLQFKYIILIFCLTTVVFSAQAQQTGLIKGVVMEKGTPNRVAMAEIWNKRTDGSVRSNDLGLFQIKAIVGDTLMIFKQDFANLQLVVATEKDMLVHLMRESNTLSQVNIYGQTKKQEMEDIKREFRNKGSYYAGKPPVLSYILSPLTAVYELFGRTPKNAKRFNNYYVSELQQTEIDRYFNETKIQKYTDLKGKQLEDFMLNYRPDYEVVKKWAEYDAIKYIQDTYKKYKAVPPKP